MVFLVCLLSAGALVGQDTLVLMDGSTLLLPLNPLGEGRVIRQVEVLDGPGGRVTETYLPEQLRAVNFRGGSGTAR